ncbi:LOW QUALITY PROTEIN: hypothetical protein CRUP_023340, partial [Coryphaenoides rupestris]
MWQPFEQLLGEVQRALQLPLLVDGVAEVVQDDHGVGGAGRLLALLQLPQCLAHPQLCVSASEYATLPRSKQSSTDRALFSDPMEDVPEGGGISAGDDLGIQLVGVLQPHQRLGRAHLVVIVGEVLPLD